MSAIKLPVKVQMAIDGSRDAELVDANGWFVAKRMSEEHAKQIALALNAHDDLVAELERLRDVVGPADEDSINAILDRQENQPKA